MRNIELVSVPGPLALVELQRAREEIQDTGFYPILLGSTDDLECIQEGMDEDYAPDQILSDALNIKCPDWFQTRSELCGDIDSADTGEWPSDEEHEAEMGIVTHLDVLTHQPKSEVLLGSFRLPLPCHIFARLNWGGWNDCPSPAEHCAVHHYWHEKYGAHVVSVTADIVQCEVSRPPATRAEALVLAREQYLYCPDIVDQGTGTIANLAAGLLNSKYWYFWWD